MSFTIRKARSATYKEKRSEFVGFSIPLKTDTDVNSFVKELRSNFPSARHICWAYRLYFNGKIRENSTDAGEPSGSAGLPILNILKQHKIVNCGIFIVRIFGGVKLGKPGLTKAYRKTAELVIDESAVINWIPKTRYEVSAAVNYFGKVAIIVKQNKGRIIQNLMTDRFTAIIEIPEKNGIQFKIDFEEYIRNSGAIKKQSEHDQTKEVRK